MQVLVLYGAKLGSPLVAGCDVMAETTTDNQPALTVQTANALSSLQPKL
jgi:hypothetical protein